MDRALPLVGRGGTARPSGRTTGPLLVLLAFSPSILSGQIQRTFGIHLGTVESRQIWTGPISTETMKGLSLGVNLDIPTPASFLSVRAGVGYVRRGTQLWDEVQDPEGRAPASVRSHYLSIPFQGKFYLRLGPGGVYLLLGPTLEQLLGTNCTQGFCSVLADERPTVLNATAGCGVFLDIGDRFRGEFEVQATEGLTEAYESTVSGVRYRSLEFLIRAAIPF